MIADTLQPPQASARSFEYPALLEHGDTAASASMEVLDGRAFQLVAVPVLAPLPIGWVVMGFAVDDALAQRSAPAHRARSFVHARAAPHGRRVLASTLDERAQQALLHAHAGAFRTRCRGWS